MDDRRPGFSDRRASERDWEKERDSYRERGRDRDRGYERYQDRNSHRRSSTETRREYPRWEGHRHHNPSPPREPRMMSLSKNFAAQDRKSDTATSPYRSSNPNNVPSRSPIHASTTSQLSKDFKAVHASVAERASLKIEKESYDRRFGRFEQNRKRNIPKYTDFPTVREIDDATRKEFDSQGEDLKERFKTNGDHLNKCVDIFLSSLNQHIDASRTKAASDASSQQDPGKSRLDALERRFQEREEALTSQLAEWKKQQEVKWETQKAESTKQTERIAHLDAKLVAASHTISRLQDEKDTLKGRLDYQADKIDSLTKAHDDMSSAVTQNEQCREVSKKLVDTMSDTLESMGNKVDRHETALNTVNQLQSAGLATQENLVKMRQEVKISQSNTAAQVGQLIDEINDRIEALQGQVQQRTFETPGMDRQSSAKPPNLEKSGWNTKDRESRAEYLKDMKQQLSQPVDLNIKDEMQKLESRIGSHDHMLARLSAATTYQPSPQDEQFVHELRALQVEFQSLKSRLDTLEKKPHENSAQEVKALRGDLQLISRQHQKLDQDVNLAGSKLKGLETLHAHSGRALQQLEHSLFTLSAQFNNMTTDELCKRMLAHIESIRSATKEPEWAHVKHMESAEQIRLVERRVSALEAAGNSAMNGTVNDDHGNKRRKMNGHSHAIDY